MKQERGREAISGCKWKCLEWARLGNHSVTHYLLSCVCPAFVYALYAAGLVLCGLLLMTMQDLPAQSQPQSIPSRKILTYLDD
jgi:hypothetical protein